VGLSARLPVPVYYPRPPTSAEGDAKKLTYEVGLCTEDLHTSNLDKLESNLKAHKIQQGIFRTDGDAPFPFISTISFSYHRPLPF